MTSAETTVVPHEPPGLPAITSAVEIYLNRIRPEWQATPLVARVRRLLPVDESSACQRLLNAATHDLRAKIRILGIDLAGQAAKSFKLPPVNSDEELEEYSTARLYDLAHRLGLVNRAEWRRLHRSYEIRRDLEHEDDEYEASAGDLIYIFETSIDIVLAREPTQVLQLRDITDIVESDVPVSIPQDLVDDYRDAPSQRQAEILDSLTFWAIDTNRPELVRSNCVRVLRQVEPLAPSSAKIALAKKLEVTIGRRPVDIETAQITMDSGAFAFIHKRQQRALVSAFCERFHTVQPGWRHHSDHGELLDGFAAAGGFATCPSGSERRIIRWMVESYVGEPGRYGTWGGNRPVFYSDTASHRIEKLLRDAPPAIAGHLDYVSREAGIRKLVANPEQDARLKRLLEITAAGE